MRITFLNMQREVRKAGCNIMHEIEAEYDNNEGGNICLAYVWDFNIIQSLYLSIIRG